MHVCVCVRVCMCVFLTSSSQLQLRSWVTSVGGAKGAGDVTSSGCVGVYEGFFNTLFRLPWVPLLGAGVNPNKSTNIHTHTHQVNPESWDQRWENSAGFSLTTHDVIKLNVLKHWHLCLEIEAWAKSQKDRLKQKHDNQSIRQTDRDKEREADRLTYLHAVDFVVKSMISIEAAGNRWSALTHEYRCHWQLFILHIISIIYSI